MRPISEPDADAARTALRARQGKGARYDSPSAPAGPLALARLGTAYFARRLNELTGAELDAPSLAPGWSRRHVVAHIGFQARGLARLVEAARQGWPQEVLQEPGAQNEDVAFGATLPDHALRYLFHHSEVHLNVEWRDLSAEGWAASVRTLEGCPVAVAQTPLMRAAAIWLAAVDLANGGTFRDFPADLTDLLLARAGDPPPVTLRPTDRPGPVVRGEGPVVSGRAADLARWLIGRGARRLEGAARLPDPPFWRPGRL